MIIIELYGFSPEYSKIVRGILEGGPEEVFLNRGTTIVNVIACQPVIGTKGAHARYIRISAPKGIFPAFRERLTTFANEEYAFIIEAAGERGYYQGRDVQSNMHKKILSHVGCNRG